ncbi:YbjN domain-containing protein [Porphyrobacter sp. AAP60]|uniref:YbjN domain-containing protein n=1 Tax=Porphyrobacter sp. AAP60 TaxID=1523423 RepID=UPI0006B8CC1C|nr:YbjN domain-containing protein [Porphyrobacter sp. AAP60]KPF64270.1 hypothetical protein IP79_05935 [Porphyrobacter sp. AAP60]
MNQINPDLLSAILADAAIDHEVRGDNDIYVTALAFNFWIRLDVERPILIFSTYWDFTDEPSELEQLLCINTLNSDLLMLQFFVGDQSNRLYGHYALPIHDGLDQRQFLRIARMFAEIFRSSISSDEHGHLFEPWPDEPEIAALAPPAPKMLN